MKLLIVSPYFYPQTGGLENYAYNIAKGLSKNHGWEVVVVTSNHTRQKIQIEKLGKIKVYRLPYLFKISNTPINPFWYWKIKAIFANEKPDLVNAHAPVPFIADMAALAKKSTPFVLTYHAGTMKKGRVLFDILITIYETLFLSRLFKKADSIICASEFVRDTLVKQYNSNNSVITPAVDTTIFKPTTKKRNNIVLFIGRHANVYPLKGLY